MIKFENNFCKFDTKNNKLKFYSDEFERLIANCGIVLDDIELNVETGDIYCYIEPIDIKHLNCKKFDKLLKDKVPYIKDIIIHENYFILIFDVENIELF